MTRTNIAFSKMEGLGNCFILVDDRQGRISRAFSLPSLSRRVCDRNFGIGADGLILVQESDSADLRMGIWNADGSQAEMCGNGVRCFARFVVDNGVSTSRTLKIETLAGEISTACLEGDLVRVAMGRPRFQAPDVTDQDASPIRISHMGREYVFVSMGNPHAVTFVKDFDFDWKKVGAQMESHPAFPNKTNVEFVKIEGTHHAEMKVWERGCGETMACGTGACAVAVAGAVDNRLHRGPVEVTLPGGKLDIEWLTSDEVMMTGPARLICEGSYYPEPAAQ